LKSNFFIKFDGSRFHLANGSGYSKVAIEERLRFTIRLLGE